MNFVAAVMVLAFAGDPDSFLKGLPTRMAQEEDEASLRRSIEMRDYEAVPPYATWTAVARGSVFQGKEAIDGIAKWEDLFRSGMGVALEYTHYYWTDVFQQSGIYVGLSGDLYSGSKASDAVGDSIDPDDMPLGAVVAGIKVQITPTKVSLGKGKDLPVSVNLRVGGGFAFVDDVEADVVLGGVPVNGVEFISRSHMFLGEAGIRLNLGPLDIGVGGRYMSAPDDGADVPRADIGPAWSGFFEAGFTLRF